jgi:hypothetical protein
VFDVFRSSVAHDGSSLTFFDNLMGMPVMKPFRDSGADAVLRHEFLNTSTLDHLGSILKIEVDFTVGVLNNYTNIEKLYGCLIPRSQTSQSVYAPVSDIQKLNPAGLNVTKLEEEDRAVFCGKLIISLNCNNFNFEKCLSNIMLPMQTDGLLPFRNTQRY